MSPVPNLMEIRQVGAALIHGDGRTDIKKANRRSSRLCERAYKLTNTFMGLILKC